METESTSHLKLKNGAIVFVDKEDGWILNSHTWMITEGYVRAEIRKNKKVKHVLLHRLILKPPDGVSLDHVDGNPLNNCKSNLRIATHSQNMWNRKKQRWASNSKRCSSVFKGVSWNKTSKKWVAQITRNGKTKSLGYFSSEEMAAQKYDEFAIEYFGEFARLNFREMEI